MSEAPEENVLPVENENIKADYAKSVEEAKTFPERRQKFLVVQATSQRQASEKEQECKTRFGVDIEGLLPLIERSVKENDQKRSEYIENVTRTAKLFADYEAQLAELATNE